MLDEDLASIFGITTKRLNEQVTRNKVRFPVDFAFRLTRGEFDDLRSQNATSSQGSGWGGRRYAPRAFTEHGAIMLANVIKSPTAIDASIQVVRAFVRLREMLAGNRDLARKLAELEKKYDERFRVVFAAIRQLENPPAERKGKIGFQTS